MDHSIYNKRKYYEVDVSWSKNKMANFIKSLVQVNTIFTSSFYIGDFNTISPRDRIFFLIAIPEGLEQKFVHLTGIKLNPYREVVSQ